ncbi:hypothetical protein M5E06_32985 [Azospirillum sp. A1-3]|nr:hypothetical protein [Azospirillum sp. A1-3]MCM8738902.1 hypothetical protein [Azospirillum sp. A1-3]
MLRSRRADLVEQEVYGLLLAHFALRLQIPMKPAGYSDLKAATVPN